MLRSCRDRATPQVTARTDEDVSDRWSNNVVSRRKDTLLGACQCLPVQLDCKVRDRLRDINYDAAWILWKTQVDQSCWVVPWCRSRISRDVPSPNPTKHGQALSPLCEAWLAVALHPHPQSKNLLWYSGASLVRAMVAINTVWAALDATSQGLGMSAWQRLCSEQFAWLPMSSWPIGSDLCSLAAHGFCPNRVLNS